MTTISAETIYTGKLQFFSFAKRFVILTEKGEVGLNEMIKDLLKKLYQKKVIMVHHLLDSDETFSLTADDSSDLSPVQYIEHDNGSFAAGIGTADYKTFTSFQNNFEDFLVSINGRQVTFEISDTYFSLKADSTEDVYTFTTQATINEVYYEVPEDVAFSLCGKGKFGDERCIFLTSVDNHPHLCRKFYAHGAKYILNGLINGTLKTSGVRIGNCRFANPPREK